MTTRSDVVDAARALLGVRFLHQGRSAAHGVDCLGLLMVVAAQLGLRFAGMEAAMLDNCDYGSRPDAVMLKAQLDRWLTSIEAAQPGDVLLLAIQGDAQHLALVSDYRADEGLAMIHAYAPARKVVEHRYDAQWQKATRGIYRLPAVTG